MPENAEVALTAEMLSEYVGCTLLAFTVIGGRYSRSKIPGLDELQTLLPCKLAAVETRGKLLWFEFRDMHMKNTDVLVMENRCGYLFNTFALEGRWCQKSPMHNSAICITLLKPGWNEVKHLWWCDHRNMGSFTFTTDQKVFEKRVEKIAVDLLFGEHTVGSLWTKFALSLKENAKWRDRTIVELLMDQNALVSGIGNYLSSEVLLEAGLDPRTLVKEIDRGWFVQLYRAMCKVAAHTYYKNETRYVQHLEGAAPQRSLHHSEYKDFTGPFKFRVYGQRLVDEVHPVEQAKLVKRGPTFATTYYCPALQKLLPPSS